MLELNNQTAPVKGYEIHVGRTLGSGNSPVSLESGTSDGAISDCNQIFGTYLHGILDTPKALALICQWAGAESIASIDHQQNQENAINRIADAVEQHMKLDLIWPELYT